MGQIQWTSGIVMLTLFTIMILGFAINWGIDNNASIDISDDAGIIQLYTNTSENLTTFGSDADNTTTSLLNTTIPQGSFTAESSGAFAITTGNLVGTFRNVVFLGYQRIFGGNSAFAIVFLSLIGMVSLIGILLVWKTLAGRNPE